MTRDELITLLVEKQRLGEELVYVYDYWKSASSDNSSWVYYQPWVDGTQDSVNLSANCVLYTQNLSTLDKPTTYTLSFDQFTQFIP